MTLKISKDNLYTKLNPYQPHLRKKSNNLLNFATFLFFIFIYDSQDYFSNMQ